MIDDEKLKEYRNIVIQRLNHTDILVSGIISSYYFKTGGISMGFLSNVLYQEPLSFRSRVNMLRNILEEMELKEGKNDLITDFRKQINKLDEMGTIRNKFAHCELIITLKEGDEYIFNPKDFRKSIDFESEYQKFIKLDNEVNPSLFKLYESMGGKCCKEIPKI